jgi:hypothetical protein
MCYALGVKPRGIVLITTLMMVLIVAMVVAAAISLSPTSLASAASYTDSQRAILAVEVGVAYAKSRFRENLGWQGSADSGPTTIVRTPDNSLVVVEDHGNVVGLIKFDSGQYGQFRIRFNHQDGADGVDGMDDPSGDYKLETALISANNLTSSSPKSLFEVGTEGSLTESEEIVQPFQAYLAVEGRAGPGLRDSDPFAPNRPSSSLRVVTKMAETRIQAKYGDTLDAAAMAAGDIKAYFSSSNTPPPNGQTMKGTRLEVRSSAADRKDRPARIRAKGDIDVDSKNATGLNLYSDNGFANTASGGFGPTTRANDTLTSEIEEESSPFYALDWDQLHHANSDPTDPETVNLDAGTYVVWEAPNGQPKVSYYDKGMDDYLAHIKDHPDDRGLVLDNHLSQARNNFADTTPGALRLWVTNHETNTSAPTSLKAQLLIKDDVYVAPTQQTSEFNFIPGRGFIDGPPPPDGDHPGDTGLTDAYRSDAIMFQFVPRPKKETVLTCPGKVNVNARVAGHGGAITAEDDIKIVGAGSIEGSEVSAGGDGLSLYSKGDVTVNSYRPNNNHVSGRYANMVIRGVVYAWGDVNFELAPPKNDTVPSSFYAGHGYLRVDGSVVAYGGDPGDEDASVPGSGSGGIGENRGNININAHNANLIYDSKYIMSLDKLASPSDMEVLSFTLR